MPQGAIPFPFGDCKICCDKATGVHYGVATCEGCKGFFKRSIPKAEKYKCFFGGQCQLSPQNRNRCKACRFQRCIETGMSMDAVKMGRIPKVDKERALEAHRAVEHGERRGISTDGQRSPQFEDSLSSVKQEDAGFPYEKSPREEAVSFTEQLAERVFLEGHHRQHHPAPSHSLHTSVPPPTHHYQHHAYSSQHGHPLSNQDSGYSDGNNSDGGSPKDSGDHGFTENASSLAEYKFLNSLEQSTSGDYNLAAGHSQDSLGLHGKHFTGSESSFLSSLRDPHIEGGSMSAGESMDPSNFSPTVLKELLSQVVNSGPACQEQILRHLSSVLPDHKALTQNLIAVLQSPQVLAELVPQLLASLTKNEGQSPLKRRYSDPGPKDDICEGLPHPPKMPSLDSMRSEPLKQEMNTLSELCDLVKGPGEVCKEREGFGRAEHYRQYERSASVNEVSSHQFNLSKVKQERTSPSFPVDCTDKAAALWEEVFRGTKAIFDEHEDNPFGKTASTSITTGDNLSMKVQSTPTRNHPPESPGDRLPPDEIPPTGGSTDNEVMIISTLNKLSEAEHLYCESLRDDIESMLETIGGKKRMDELNYLSQATYRQVRIVWRALFDDITSVNKMIISLCQAIPGFVKLDLAEQAKLMEDAYFDIWLILFAVLFVDNESYIRLSGNIHYTRFWMKHFLTESLIEKMFNFCRELNVLKLSRLEICVLCAIQLTHPDRSDKEEVRLLHSHFLDVLVYTIEKSHPVNHSRILVNLFRILPLLQAIQVEQAQVISTFRAEKPPERCENMVVVGSIEEELARVQMEKAEEEEASKMQNNTGNTDSFCDNRSGETSTIEERLWSDTHSRVDSI